MTAAGAPWFSRFRAPEALLTDDGSPLDENEKVLLREALAGRALEGNVEATLKKLGIRALSS